MGKVEYTQAVPPKRRIRLNSYSEAASIGIKRSRVANYEKSARGFERVYNSIGEVTNYMRNDVSLDDAKWKKDLEEYD